MIKYNNKLIRVKFSHEGIEQKLTVIHTGESDFWEQPLSTTIDIPMNVNIFHNEDTDKLHANVFQCVEQDGSHNNNNSIELHVISVELDRVAALKETLLHEVYNWGRPVKLHEIGDYQIIEYKAKHPPMSDKRGFEEHSRFKTYVLGREVQYEFTSLDEALIGAIAKNNCDRADLAHYIMKMFKKD